MSTLYWLFSIYIPPSKLLLQWNSENTSNKRLHNYSSGRETAGGKASEAVRKMAAITYYNKYKNNIKGRLLPFSPAQHVLGAAGSPRPAASAAACRPPAPSS